MANTYLQRTPTTRTNNQKFTYSCWFKRSELGTSQYFVINLESGNDRGYVAFDTDNKIFIFDKAGGTERFQATSNFVLRDTSAWYHLVYSVDSTAGSNRVKIYINGVDKYDDFTISVAMSQNSTVGFQQGTVSNSFKVGAQETGSTTFSGLISHINFVDGLQLDASSFGETDTTTGQWKIKTSPTVSEYGNNGFFILKNSNSVTDQSGKGNNLTVGAGTLTNTLDCPDNVFATMNSLDNFWSTSTYANGNNTVTSANNGYTYSTSTFGVATGKWYWEIKWSAQPTGSSDQVQIGIAKRPAPSSTTWLGQQLYTYGYQGSSGHVQNNNVNASGSVATPYSVGDIISVAMDLDNNKIHFAKNGAWTNSSDPAANSGGVTITAPDSTPEDSGFYFAAFGDSNVSLQETGQFNFGNGFFGTSAVADNSTATASTPGTFNYDVPAGYQPLSTKGLNA